MSTTDELGEDERALLLCIHELAQGESYVPVSTGQLATRLGWEPKRVIAAGVELRRHGLLGGTLGQPKA